MTVIVIDICGNRSEFKHAEITLTSKTLLVHAPDEKGNTVLHNFILQNIVYYSTRLDNERKETQL